LHACPPHAIGPINQLMPGSDVCVCACECLAQLGRESGKVAWQWSDGTASSDIIQSLVVSANGSVVLAGYTAGGRSRLCISSFLVPHGNR
jgi:hypothetical protein